MTFKTICLTPQGQGDRAGGKEHVRAPFSHYTTGFTRPLAFRLLSPGTYLQKVFPLRCRVRPSFELMMGIKCQETSTSTSSISPAEVNAFLFSRKKQRANSPLSPPLPRTLCTFLCTFSEHFWPRAVVRVASQPFSRATGDAETGFAWPAESPRHAPVNCPATVQRAFSPCASRAVCGRAWWACGSTGGGQRTGKPLNGTPLGKGKSGPSPIRPPQPWPNVAQTQARRMRP